jgi:hypothetical protein
MVNTRYLSTAVEDHVRDVLSAEYQIVFRRQRVKLQPGGYHEFDAVSDNGRVVASVKTAAATGRHPGGTLTNCLAELYLLTIVRAHKKILVLTSPDFHRMFMAAMAGKVPNGIAIMHVPLPAEIQARVESVQQAGTDETQPILDSEELRAAGGH